jgi:hypothetical protein
VGAFLATYVAGTTNSYTNYFAKVGVTQSTVKSPECIPERTSTVHHRKSQTKEIEY